MVNANMAEGSVEALLCNILEQDSLIGWIAGIKSFRVKTLHNKSF